MQEVDLSEADPVQLLLKNTEHEDVSCNVQRHVS